MTLTGILGTLAGRLPRFVHAQAGNVPVSDNGYTLYAVDNADGSPRGFAFSGSDGTPMYYARAATVVQAADEADAVAQSQSDKGVIYWWV